MKTILFISISAISSFFLLFNKNEEPKNSKKETIERLTNCKWKMTDETTVANGRTVNTFEGYKDCVKDDTFTFYNNGNITIDENVTKCMANAPQKSNGIWAFNAKESNKLDIALTMDFTAEIVELTATKLVWKYQNAVGDVVMQSFTKQ